MNLADDVDSIKRFKQGDLSAFEEIVRRYQDRIYNLCRYMLQDTQDAQDAAQDAFVKAYTGLKGFKPDSALYTWLYRIAVNNYFDHKRKSRPERFEGEAIAEEQPSTEPSAERSLRHELRLVPRVDGGRFEDLRPILFACFRDRPRRGHIPDHQDDALQPRRARERDWYSEGSGLDGERCAETAYG